MSDITDLARETIRTYEELQRAKRQLALAEHGKELAEARVRVSGQITGRNEQERKDALALLAEDDPSLRLAYMQADDCRYAVLHADIAYFTAERQYQAARYELAASHPDIKSSGLLAKLFG